MRINKDKATRLSIHEDARDMLERAYDENIGTVWKARSPNVVTVLLD
ncbi:MAG: hypothetical protein ACMUIP_00750 [bacterium]